MKLSTLTLLIIVFSICFVNCTKSRDRNNKPYKAICYWGTWSFYRPGDGKFQAEDIDPKLCTHLVYAFAKLENNAIAVFDPNLDIGDTDWQKNSVWGHGMFRRFNELRKANPHLSTMIAIGGWNEGSDKYSAMARDPRSRKIFVKSVITFLKEHNFDGLDLDWEYPAMQASGGVDRQPGRAEDKQDFIDLIKELNEAFKPYGYILSAAVSAGKSTIDRAYDVPKLSKYLDFIHLMTYDFHGAWDKVTGHNAPLFAHSSDAQHDLSVAYAVDYWLQLGVDPKKLILGIPFYGRTFTLAGPQNGFGAPVSGNGGKAGPFTRQAGTLGYNEICSMLKEGGWKKRFSKSQQVTYVTRGDQWISYDNVKSVQRKMAFLAKRKLGGAFVWSLETDDFKGRCGHGRYPLLRTINRALEKVSSTTWGTANFPENKTHISSTRPWPIKPTVDNFVCTAAGVFPSALNPTKVHLCLKIEGKLKLYKHNCQMHLTAITTSCHLEMNKFFMIFQSLTKD